METSVNDTASVVVNILVNSRRTSAGLSEFNQVMARVVKIAERGANDSRSAFQSRFGANFFANIASNLVSFVGNALRQIPSLVKQTLNEAVTIANERFNALKGLGSIAEFVGVTPADAENAVRNLRLVKAGIVDLGEATTGLKNLLQAGFSLPQSITLLERFSDTAAFGKQAALDYGEAIRSATEGIKNQNSILVDNAGVTKNLSVILKERGFVLQDLSDETTKAAATEALYQGLIKETAAQMGDADKLTQGYTGSTAALEQAQRNLLDVIGQMIIKSPEMMEANKILTEQIQGYTGAVQESGSETSKWADSLLRDYAKIKAGSINLISTVIESVGLLRDVLSIGGSSALVLFVAPWEAAIKAISAGLNALINNFTFGLRTVAGLMSSLGFKTDAFNLVDFERLSQPLDTSIDLNITRQFAFTTRQYLDSSSRRINSLIKLNSELDDIFRRIDNASRTSTPSRFLGGDRVIENINRALTGDGTTGGTTGGTGSTGGRGGSRPKFALGSRAAAVVQAANSLGVDPLDLASIISFETAGTFRPDIYGKTRTKYGRHRGLIQFGEPQARQYNVNFGSFEQQVTTSVVDYIRDAFNRAGASTQGASLLQLYASVIGGNPNNVSATDANGFSARRALGLIAGQHRQNALRRLFGGSASNVPRGANLSGLSAREEEDLLRQERIARGRAIASRFGVFGEAGLITGASDALPTGTFENLKNVDEQFVENFRESFQIGQRLERLMFVRRNDQSILNALLDDYNVGLDEQLQAEKEALFLAFNRNQAKEQELAFERSRTEQQNAFFDVEKELAVLRRQNADDQFTEQRRLISAKQEELFLEREITELQDEYYNAEVNQNLRVRRALISEIVALKREELRADEDIVRAGARIANLTVFSQTQANARILEHIAGMRSLTQIYADAKIAIVDKVWGGLDALFQKLTGRLPVIGSILSQILADITKLLLNPLILRLLGLGGAAPSSGGGIFGGGGAGGFLGNIFGGIFGGGGNAAGGTPPFVGNFASGGAGGLFNLFGLQGGGSGSGNRAALSTSLPFAGEGLAAIRALASAGNLDAQAGLGNIAGGAAATAATGGFSLSALSGLAPLLGLPLGASLGGSSIGGQILGGAGGLIGGLGIASLLGNSFATSIFGSIGGSLGLGLAGTAALSTVAFAAAPLLLFGAFILGRNKRRRQEERVRTRILLDSKRQMEDILRQLRAGNIDSATALSQAALVRQNYLEQVGQLKDSKTRRIAQQTVRELDYLIKQIEAQGRITDAAAALDQQLIPTFATGGAGFGLPSLRTRETALVQFSPESEVILNRQQISNLGGYPALRRAGVSGLPMVSRRSAQAFGGNSSAAGAGAQSNRTAGAPNVTVFVVADERTARTMAKKAGGKVLIETMKPLVESGQDDGLVASFVDRMVQGTE